MGATLALEADHRRHAEIELVIRDLKEGPWAHMPSGRFGTNAAWLALGAIAHNLARWSAPGGPTERRGPIAFLPCAGVTSVCPATSLAPPGDHVAPGKRLALG